MGDVEAAAPELAQDELRVVLGVLRHQETQGLHVSAPVVGKSQVSVWEGGCSKGYFERSGRWPFPSTPPVGNGQTVDLNRPSLVFGDASRTERQPLQIGRAHV